MTIAVERLATLEDFAALERLERRLLGEPPGSALLGVPSLRAIADSGGLLLGVRENRVTRDLAAASVDLRGTHERFPALFSHLFAVAPEEQGRGVGLSLRVAERSYAQTAGIEVIRAWMDPLRSRDSHILWNRLGAIGTAYERNVYGELADRTHRGLATDRVAVEWWLRSPRTEALVDEGRAASHIRAPLHEMTVATRTSAGPAGQRVLAGVDVDRATDSVLVEIPADVDALQDADADEARRWRLGTREAFERLLATGYLLTGLVHEGGRSFQLLEKVDRAAVLGVDAARRSAR